MDNKLIMSVSPHIRKGESVTKTMSEVIIGLIPALVAAVYFFGPRALTLTLVSVIACVLSEYIWNKIIKKDNTITDLSAVVTGMLIAFCLPATVPYYMVIVGDVFAIIVVKGFFGGLGKNIVNPALAARAFMLASWPVEMTTFVSPHTSLKLFGKAVDTVSSATPLSVIKGTGDVFNAEYFDLLFGNVPGCIGEISAVCILLGGLYLLFNKIITWHIPVTYILTVGIFAVIFGDKADMANIFVYNILSGGVLLAAFFMATDYVTSPVTKKGEIIFAIGAGFITEVIRVYGGYPEGVTYAILIMNICVPFIDKYTAPRVFGEVKKNGK